MLRLSRLSWSRGAAIVGLPNIGKSTLFNALTATKLAKTGNYPFCTIKPNVSKADVYDERLEKLSKFSGAKQVVNVSVELTDVAGLIAGSSKGKGLGNQFLGDIRSCQCVLHLVRCFENSESDKADPLSDITTIRDELCLSDMQTMDKLVAKLKKQRKPDDPELLFCERVSGELAKGAMALGLAKSDTESKWLSEFGLLTAKKSMFVLNVDDESITKGNAWTDAVQAAFPTVPSFRICATLEDELADLPQPEQAELLKAYGLQSTQTAVLLRRVRQLLGYESFFTVGPLTAHGWSFRTGATARQAAGVIHTDFEKHFLRARVLQWSEFVTSSTLDHAERRMRAVDAPHIMTDGDVFVCDHNAPRRD